jgi:hypothetical protein
MSVTGRTICASQSLPLRIASRQASAVLCCGNDSAIPSFYSLLFHGTTQEKDSQWLNA